MASDGPLSALCHGVPHDSLSNAQNVRRLSLHYWK